MSFCKANSLVMAILASLFFSISVAEDKDKTKELSGISIMGNKEAPKSLFIVPWKSSELGDENSLSSSLLNEKMVPVDKDVFQRELDFYSATLTE